MSLSKIKEEETREDDESSIAKSKSSLEKRYEDQEFAHKLSFQTHIHRTSVFIFYTVVGLFYLLTVGLIVYTALSVFYERFSTDAKWYSILLAFLSGALGAGFGDSIFRRVKKHWDD